MKALDHIRDFYNDDRFDSEEEGAISSTPKKGRRLNHEDRRLLAIELQRDRLQRQLSSANEETVDRDGSPNEASSTALDAENAWIRFACCLNSLAVITPTVLKILRHQRRNDTSLVIHGTKIKGAGKAANRRERSRTSCWLLGEKVFDNLKAFCAKKKKSDEVFDSINPTLLNNHLKNFMEGLSAKVFRTYNASRTLQEELRKAEESTSGWKRLSPAEKVVEYNNANREVAILCNHQRSVSKAQETQLENLGGKLEMLKKQNQALMDQQMYS